MRRTQRTRGITAVERDRDVALGSPLRDRADIDSRTSERAEQLRRHLLGREPACEFDVVLRDEQGWPIVIRNAPFLHDGTPMPTRYWLVGERERVAVSRLEAAGGVRAAEAAIDPDELADAHRRYAYERDRAVAASGVPPDRPAPSGGVGGTRTGVKCLHTHYAWFLAGDLQWDAWRADLGLRREANDQRVVTLDPFTPGSAPIVARIDETDLLPSGSLTWSHSENAQLRLAFARTVSRPDFRELSSAPYTDPLLDISVHALPVTYRSTAAPSGTVVHVEIAADERRTYALVRTESQWSVARADEGAAACTIRVAADVAWRLLFNALPPEEARGRLHVSGDVVVGVHPRGVVAAVDRRPAQRVAVAGDGVERLLQELRLGGFGERGEHVGGGIGEGAAEALDRLERPIGVDHDRGEVLVGLLQRLEGPKAAIGQELGWRRRCHVDARLDVFPRSAGDRGGRDTDGGEGRRRE